MDQRRRIVRYQLDHLRAEADLVLGDSNHLALYVYLNPVFRFLTHHFQNFYWTVIRLAGLNHSHDDCRGDALTISRPILKVAVPPQQKHPRILIDTTETFICARKTGIQRVAREIAAAAATTGDGFPIVIKDGRFVPYYWHQMLADSTEIEDGDLLLLIDEFWYKTDTYLPIMLEVAKKGCRIVVGIHDLIPLRYPYVFKASHVDAFRRWLASAVPLADAVVTFSRSVATDVCDYLATSDLTLKPGFAVGWHHLGADFAADSDLLPSRELVDLCDQGPFFLTVGTIEPRKAHTIALSAFEKLWSAGVDVRYVIIGAYGWGCCSVRKRISEHPELGRRLFWFDRASDADLRHAYRRAMSLVYPSFAEGFGLPVVEAAHHGLSIIASDIPIFREIGGESIAYFNVLNPDSLADRISEFLNAKKVVPSFPVLTWPQAAEGFLKLIRKGDYQFPFAK